VAAVRRRFKLFGTLLCLTALLLAIIGCSSERATKGQDELVPVQSAAASSSSAIAQVKNTAEQGAEAGAGADLKPVPEADAKSDLKPGPNDSQTADPKVDPKSDPKAGQTADPKVESKADSGAIPDVVTPAVDSITLSITGNAEWGTVLDSESVMLAKGDTAASVLKRAAKAHRLSYEIRGSGAMTYVEGIDGLYEFDDGPMSGWKFRVNGVIPDIGAGAYTLKAGDRLEWFYSAKEDTAEEEKEPAS